MTTDERIYPSGKTHYSGTNRVPTIREFLDRLDRLKPARDAQLEEEQVEGEKAQAQGQAQAQQHHQKHPEHQEQREWLPETEGEVFVKEDKGKGKGKGKEGKEKEKEKEVIGGGEEEQKEHTIGVQTHTQGQGREDGYDWIHRAPSSASQIKQKLVGGKSKANQHGESGSKEDVTPIPPVRPPSDPNKPGKNRRIVRDPVTRQDVEIADVTGREMRQADEPKITVPLHALNPSSSPSLVDDDDDDDDDETQFLYQIISPSQPQPPSKTSFPSTTTTEIPLHHTPPTNVLFHPTPTITFSTREFESLTRRSTALCLITFLSLTILSITSSRPFAHLLLAVLITSLIYFFTKNVIKRGLQGEWHAEARRGRTALLSHVPESAEWLNALLKTVWTTLDAERVFSGVGDTLEDVMQASVPRVVEHVKVKDLSQGKEPIRVVSIRALANGEVGELKKTRQKEVRDPEEVKAEEEGGGFYNLEMTVAYHARETTSTSGGWEGKVRENVGMQIVFYLGVKGLFGVPVPIWVELRRLVATLRLRVALAPCPPFVRTVSFTLMGQPKVEASCVPLVRQGTNILELPLVAEFVNWAIATAADMYVAPRSMTIDVGKLLQGDDIKKDTNALGVLYVRIRKATGLSKQDRRGSKGGGSDPYVVVSFSKFSKPLYCTRVIEDDLNPIFEESCGLTVTAEVIKADEQLSMELWDSDRSSADDLVGKVEVSIQELMQQPGKMIQHVSKLRGIKAGSTMPGLLHWEVGYFTKAPFRRAMRTNGLDPTLPEELRSKPELQDEHGSIDDEEEDAVVHTPPDPLWRSGVLSVVVHRIVGLEFENVKGSHWSWRRRHEEDYDPARPEAGEAKEEQSGRLPNAYCTILINDELVYKTRVKAVSSRPIFEAGTERFVRDWRCCIVTVTVRDARNRQHDPIIGVVSMRLGDVLRTSSQSTRWYPLDGGIGFGRVRISLLFRSIAIRLPPSQIGFGEVGTWEFLCDSITTTDYAPSERTKLKLRTGGSSATIPSSSCSRREGDPPISGLSWSLNPPSIIRLPIRARYRSPIVFAFHPPGKRHRTDVYATLWLCDIPDWEEREITLPIWRCSNAKRLTQNYITESNLSTVPDLEVTEVGRVHFKGRFKPGTDRDHIRFVRDNDSRETIETWEACFAEGVRGEEVEGEVPGLVRELYEESLVQGRDVLALAGEGERRRWFGRREGDEEGSDSSEGETGEGDDEDGSEGSHEKKYTCSAESSTGPIAAYKAYKERSRDLNRRHRGLMQWKAMRNIQFAKDEAVFAAKKLMKVGSLSGRKPDVETEV